MKWCLILVVLLCGCAAIRGYGMEQAKTALAEELCERIEAAEEDIKAELAKAEEGDLDWGALVKALLAYFVLSKSSNFVLNRNGKK